MDYDTYLARCVDEYTDDRLGDAIRARADEMEQDNDLVTDAVMAVVDREIEGGHDRMWDMFAAIRKLHAVKPADLLGSDVLAELYRLARAAAEDVRQELEEMAEEALEAEARA